MSEEKVIAAAQSAESTNAMTNSDTKATWTHIFDWAYVGVDHNLPGNGGQDCVDFLPLWQRLTETFFACLFAAVVSSYAIKNLKLPEKIPPPEKSDRCGKRILLVVMCLTFGIEMGFKFATKQVIWLLNPCHVTSMIQIYLLAAPPSRFVTTMFRIHLHMLTGAPIAILFPVINTRLLPFETEIYFIQHILIMIIPYYLIRIGGVYRPEPLSDKAWACLALGWLYFLYFVPVQWLAYVSHVNLNNMLCPAVSDPFYGRTYRLWAMTHELIFLPLIAKFVVYTAGVFNLIPECNIVETYVFRKNSFNENTNTGSLMQKEEDSLNHKTVPDSTTKLKERNGFVPNESGEHFSNENGHIKKS